MPKHLLTPISCILLIFCATTLAHPYHTSFAEIGWSEDNTVLEISLRVLPEDLETALTWRSGKAVVLGQSEAVQGLAEAYLRDHFQVLEAGRKPLSLSLVGIEANYDETWLYFTVAARPDMRLRLRNTVLMEVSRSQTNRVRPLWASPEATLVLTREAPEAPLWTRPDNIDGELLPPETLRE
jgi:hypothetical protein